jgi:hypothetical protein
LSFLLGQPLLYLGHTEYDDKWHATHMQSVDASTMAASALDHVAFPPFPINGQQYANYLDSGRLTEALRALLANYDDLKFEELSWAYWFAVFAPVHMSAVHFGALLERLQRIAAARLAPSKRQLLPASHWEELNGLMKSWIANSNLEPTVAAILKGKTSSLNQPPPGLLLHRIFEEMGLELTDVEGRAWAQRNKAAHGGMSDEGPEAILNAKLLRLMFVRLVAALTNCANSYIDYYSFDFPTRPLSRGIPSRPAS